jgi:hypothetical protein
MGFRVWKSSERFVVFIGFLLGLVFEKVTLYDWAFMGWVFIVEFLLITPNYLYYHPMHFCKLLSKA